MAKQSAKNLVQLDSFDAVHLEDALNAGVSRRTLLKWLSGMGIGAVAGLPMIDAAATSAGANAVPVNGGSVKIASAETSTTDTLDPARGSNSTDYARHYMFYNGLTTLDEHLAAKMTLAESFDTTDGQNWTVKLRKGITFHDGSPFTSADVVYSLTRHKDGAVGSKVKALAMQMNTIEADGANGVRIVLASPNDDLPVMLAVSHFLIVKNGARDFTKANGTGPFRCESFSPGTSSVAVRNEKYWKPGLPHLDRIELIGIVDETARVNALISGEVDMIGAISPTSARQLSRVPDVVMMETKAGSYTDIVMRVDQTPGNQADFALATKYMLNREQISKTVYQGYAVVANDHPISPSNPYFNSSLPQRPYDPDKARFHLKKAGLSSPGVEVVVSPAAANSAEIAELWQQTAKAVGLNLSLRRVPGDGYWSNQWMKHPITFGATNARPTADLVLSLYFQSDSPWNESGWKKPDFDKMLVAARGERDQSKRIQLYWDMQQMISNEGGIGIPVFRSALDAFSTKVKGMKPIPLGNFMGYMFPENIWLQA
ncbi:ABC transporter substrate-binding protein [Caballeronia sp. AZ7_KS35]|uniref:ABC transporter substrate-binding protein n=1 Tax=Caballeronia sp. AZ7_KS35 TaxID=2921762 RepID=UPI0020288A78|nr:ABC transporter substrate-binding protein [Caballeronia sp. AZ7_KS35]